MMKQTKIYVTIVVKDYDEAIDFYTQRLGFTLVEDTKLSPEKRWVLVAPAASQNFCFLLAKASNERQIAAIGNQTGGRVGFFLHIDNFNTFYNRLIQNNINIIRPPKDEPYGTVAVFEDLYGNYWDLIQPK